MSRRDQLVAQAKAFDAAHPEVWREFERLALDAISEGVPRWSAKGIMEVVRWNLRIQADAGKRYAINNNYTALYARRFQRRHPEHADFFEVRQQTSAERIARVSA